MSPAPPVATPPPPPPTSKECHGWLVQPCGNASATQARLGKPAVALLIIVIGVPAEGVRDHCPPVSAGLALILSMQSAGLSGNGLEPRGPRR